MTSTKVALITGAAQRIGAQLARALHARSYNVVIHYNSSAAAAEEIARDLNALRENSACALSADMQNVSAVQQLAADAQAAWGRVDVLINNASSYYSTPWDSATEHDWDRLVGSNLKGPFFLTQALLPELAARSGCVVNMIDIFAERPIREFPLYCMAKAGVAMLTKSLAVDYGKSVRVNGIAPGAILWPEPPLSAEEQARMLAKIPTGQIGHPDDIVRTALFLIEDAPYINGQIIAVDGGLSLNT
ncbi:MAG TPA: pteridine reductase [Spongiibacteraceae bacterium]|nr:pteridine reductase [Spongiibacteraceae bacterium]